MAFQTTPEVDFSSVGLITDMPAHALPQGAWSDCLNIRVKDGSVQGVNDFVDSFTVPAAYSGSRPVAVTQWTPAGSDHLNIAYIIESTHVSDVAGKGRVFVFNTSTSVTVEITNGVESFLVDNKYPPQLFVFNGLLVCNSGTSKPSYISADSTTQGTLVELPGWTSMAGHQFARVLRPYKNRLIAMSFFDNNGTETIADDRAYPVDLAWSSHITTLDSLSGVEWQATTTNTSGDAFLTQTPGRILDGGQLGENFIAYKSDAVVRVYETGDSYVLGFDSIFEDDGIYSTRCFANIGDSQHLVIGNYGVYLHDGQSSRKDLAKGKFQDALFNSVNSENRSRSFVFHQTRDKEVWFCFKEGSGVSTGCNKAYVYNYLSQSVHIRTLPNVADLFETELNGELAIYAATSSNSIKQLSNTTYETQGWFIRTEDSLSDSTRVKDIERIFPESSNAFKISVVCTGGPLTYSALNTLFNSNELNYNPTTSHKLDVRESGRYLNLRVTMDLTTNPKLTTMQFSLRAPSRR